MRGGGTGSSRARTTLGNLLRLLVGCVLGMLLAEVGARLYLSLPSDPAQANFVPDPEADYRIRPDRPEEIVDPEDHFTALGVRGREHELTKPPGTFRILGIGDSFVFGSVPMRQNFLRVLETRANGRVSRAGSLEVIPLGVPGYNPENYLGILRSVGFALDPDLVIVFFFVGNDVTGIPVRGRVYRGELYYVGSSSPWIALLRRSRFLMLAETVVLRTLKLIHGAGEEVSAGGMVSSRLAAPEGERMQTSDDEITLPYLLFQKRRLPIYASSPSPRIDGLWEEAEGYLSEIDRTCREAGVPWILVSIPAEVQVDERVRTAVLDALSLSAQSYDFEAPQRRLGRLAERLGVEHIDLLPTLRSAQEEEGRLYIPNNTHWNVTGNRIVGELLARTLEDHVASP